MASLVGLRCVDAQVVGVAKERGADKHRRGHSVVERSESEIVDHPDDRGPIDQPRTTGRQGAPHGRRSRPPTRRQVRRKLVECRAVQDHARRVGGPSGVERATRHRLHPERLEKGWSDGHELHVFVFVVRHALPGERESGAAQQPGRQCGGRLRGGKNVGPPHDFLLKGRSPFSLSIRGHRHRHDLLCLEAEVRGLEVVELPVRHDGRRSEGDGDGELKDYQSTAQRGRPPTGTAGAARAASQDGGRVESAEHKRRVARRSEGRDESDARKQGKQTGLHENGGLERRFRDCVEERHGRRREDEG